MSFIDILNEDLKNALKEKNEIKLAAIRQIKTHVTNAEIKKGKMLTEEEIGTVVFSLIKSHNESIESFKSGNRPDLVEKEEKELFYLKHYLPEQLSDEELKNVIVETIKETGAVSGKDIGRVMGKLMPKVKGKADGAKEKLFATQILDGQK
mgnify:CR=1 FL=1